MDTGSGETGLGSNHSGCKHPPQSARTGSLRSRRCSWVCSHGKGYGRSGSGGASGAQPARDGEPCGGKVGAIAVHDFLGRDVYKVDMRFGQSSSFAAVFLPRYGQSPASPDGGTTVTAFPPLLFTRPGAARRLVTFLARPRKVTKRRPPLVSRPLSGVPLRCLTRQGGCGTRPGRAHKTCPTMGLTRFPAGASWGGIRIMGACIDVGGPSPGACSRKRAALNVSTGAQSSPKTPRRVELLGAPQGVQGQTQHGLWFLLSPQYCSYPVTTSIEPRRGFG